MAITLRDHFASMVAAGLTASGDPRQRPDAIAARAYAVADALITHRNASVRHLHETDPPPEGTDEP